MNVTKKDQGPSLSHYAVAGEATGRVFGTFNKIVAAANSFLVLGGLSVFQFGFYQLILSFTSLARNLSVDLFDGLVSLEMRGYFSKGKAHLAKKLFKENIVFKISVALIGSAVIFFSADIISRWYGQDVAFLIRWVSIIPIINAIQSIISIFSDAIVSFADQSIPAIKEFAKLAILLVFLLLFKLTLLAVIIAYVISEAVGTVVFLLFIFINKYRKVFHEVGEHPDRVMIPFIKTHGVRVFFVYGAKQILSQIEPWLIKLFVNVEAVAYYSFAFTLLSMLQDLIPLAGFKAVLYLKINEEEALGFIYKRVVKYATWSGGVLCVASLIGIPLGVFLLLPKYLPSMPVFILLACTLPLYGVMKITTTTLGVLREYATLAMRLINELLILLIGAVILLPRIGILGMGIIEIVQISTRIWFLYARMIKKHPVFKLKARNLMTWDRLDAEYANKALSHFLGFFRKKPV